MPKKIRPIHVNCDSTHRPIVGKQEPDVMGAALCLPGTFPCHWARQYFFGFEPPETGHGPIANRSRLPSGQSNPDQLVGDYSDPILKPAAAEILKRRGEITLSGTPFPDPNNQCSPQQVAYILWQWEIQLVQQKDQVVILYM